MQKRIKFAGYSHKILDTSVGVRMFDGAICFEQKYANPHGLPAYKNNVTISVDMQDDNIFLYFSQGCEETFYMLTLEKSLIFPALTGDFQREIPLLTYKNFTQEIPDVATIRKDKKKLEKKRFVRKVLKFMYEIRTRILQYSNVLLDSVPDDKRYRTEAVISFLEKMKI